MRVGVGATIEDAAKGAMDASTAGVKAGDPELAAMNDDFGLVWIEHGASPKGEMHAAIATCK